MGDAFITRRGGGAGLALKVLGSTSTPDHVKNNTIWVNTDTAITSYALQHDQPLNPTPGMVWIQTSYFSFAEMDVDKKNNVTVYPIAAFQYINGAWVDKEAKSYINGQWKDWVVTVYNGEADISHWVRSTAAATGNKAYTEDGFMHIYRSDSGGARYVYDTPFDLTNIAAVRYYGYAPDGWTAGNRQLGVATTLTGENQVGIDYGTPVWAKTDPLTYRDLNVSNLTGEYYIRIGNTNDVYIKRIVLIPIGGNI